MRIAVVGAGAWGTALAAHACRLGHDVALWAHEADVVEAIRASHENTPFLPGVKLPEGLMASTDPHEVTRGAAIVLLVPPSEHLRRVCALAAPGIGAGALVVVASKGIEETSHKLMSEVVAESLPSVEASRVAFLSGPSFAREVAAGLPTDVVLASRPLRSAEIAQDALHAPMFRAYASEDPVGVQVGGAIKNVIAVAAGACDGLALGLNARAALTTRGLAEMSRLGVALGADPLTFLGLAGVGDLFLTCGGALSRNRALGVAVAEGQDPKAYVASQRSVAEGYRTSAAAWALARDRGVDMPIVEQVYHVLHEGRPLLEAMRRLVTRERKHELHGLVHRHEK